MRIARAGAISALFTGLITTIQGCTDGDQFVALIWAIIVAFFMGGSGDQIQPASAPVSVWPIFMHDQQHTGRTGFIGPSSPTQKWAFDTGNPSVPVTGNINSP